MSQYILDHKQYADRLSRLIQYDERGRVSRSVGLTLEGYLPNAAVGSLVTVKTHTPTESSFDAEVVGFKDRKVLLMPLEDHRGTSQTSQITLRESQASVVVGDFLLGRVLDGRGEPIDGKGPLIRTYGDERSKIKTSIYASCLNPLERPPVEEVLDLGVRAINGFLTVGKGQRIGIMAGSGVGKSVLLGMMARYTKAQVNVIALIGERGREVREFIERDLGEEGLKRSVIVVSTSDKSPLLRMRGAFVATTIAEYFANQNKDVLLMMDSVTRFCMAQREIGLSIGEPPASKGYTPSVFATLPRLLERAGNRTRGSITGIYTVLAEGDDMDEPIVDAARSILDGHIVLSRSLASKNHYPAIDVAQSISRVMSSVAHSDHKKFAAVLRELMAVYAQNEDLISIGAYVKGANAKLDQAVSVVDRITSFLRQDVAENTSYAETVQLMQAVIRSIG